uniref:Uncharacterized protein n=1 Tax=Rhizophora mucronata TaxID=61149 RepID=A0A2P2Q5Z2_RHIMU
MTKSDYIGNKINYSNNSQSGRTVNALHITLQEIFLHKRNNTTHAELAKMKSF